MIDTQEWNRARWAARRGMLELDLVLGPFVERCYPELDEADRYRFQQLMQFEDQQLYAWLMRREEPSEDVRVIVDRIVEFTTAGTTHR